MKRNRSIALLTVLMMILCITACSGGNVRKAKTREEARQLADDFLGSLVDQNRYILTTSADGAVQSTTTVDGDNLYIHYDDESYTDMYLFVENGMKYIMYEGDQPYQDDELYDMFLPSSAIGLEAFIDFIVSDDSDMNVEGTLTTGKKDGKISKELVITGSTTDGDSDYQMSITGSQLDGLLTGYVLNMKTGDMAYSVESAYEYGDAISVIIPEHEVSQPREYRHIDSPYATIGDVINRVGTDGFSSTIMDGTLYTAVDTLQIAAAIPDDTAAQLDALDVFDDDYDQKLHDLIKDLEVKDCIDFSEYILADDELVQYIGNDVENMISNGFESNGWSISEDGSIVWVEKDGFVYEVDIELPEGFDPEQEFEFEDLYPSIVRSIRFLEVAMLPLE